VEVLTALLNTVLVAFVVTTMLSAGLRTSIPALLGVLRKALLVVLVLVANLPVASWLARRRTADTDHASERAAAEDVELTELGATRGRRQRTVPERPVDADAHQQR